MPDTLSEVLDALDAACGEDEVDAERVLALAERALQIAPADASALHHRAAALEGMGRLEDARDAYREALVKAPDDVELLLSAAGLAIADGTADEARTEEGLRLCAQAMKQAKATGDGPLEVELLLMEAIAHSQRGDAATALSRAESALQLDPESLAAQLERGLALFELCQFDASLKALEALKEPFSEDAWLHHHLGLLYERRGDGKRARRAFLRAQELAPDEFPAAVELEDDAFDAAVKDAVAQLPPQFQPLLANTALAVQPFPTEEDLLAQSPPLSPTLLGVFHGTPIGQRSVSSAADHFPSRIILYQRNLERFATTREELIEQIQVTVVHEVGHLVGLDEEALEKLGLE